MHSPIAFRSFKKAAQNMAWLHMFEGTVQQSLQPFGVLLKSHGKTLSTNNLRVTDESGQQSKSRQTKNKPRLCKGEQINVSYRVCQPRHGENSTVQAKDPHLQNQGRELEFFCVSPFTKPAAANMVHSDIIQALASPARWAQLLMASSHLQSELGVLCAGGLGVPGEVQGIWERAKRVTGFELRSETRDLSHKPNKDMHPIPAQEHHY